MSSSRLEAVLRAGQQQQRPSAPVGVVRWEPPPGMVWDDDGNAVPEPPSGGNPHRLPAGQEWVSASVAEGERAENERMVDHTLIDSIPSMQQQIRSLMRRVAELEAKDEARAEREWERERERAQPTFRDLAA